MSDNKLFLSLKKIHWSVWLGLIIVFAVIRLCVLFSYRDGHHVDETWSYGYANSYYLPHVFGGYSEETEQNIGEWITGETFRDYITVREDQRFSFDSVMFNKKDDLSPVLYAFILHFVCSLFPGQFSWGFAFFVSILFYVPSLILIYVLSKEMTDSKLVGFASVIYYVFSGCGTGNFLYLRVYHLFTFLTLLLFFLIHRIITNKGKKMWIYYLLLPVVTLLGCLTHYYFLVMAFGLTLFGGIAILCKKRLKNAFSVGVIMLLSVIAFFLLYSPALAKILPYSTGETSSTGYYHYPYYFDAAIANIHFFLGTIGWYIQFSVANILYFIGIVVFIAIVIALMVFLFRNEEWMKNTVIRTKKFLKYTVKQTFVFCSEFNLSLVVAALSSVFYMLVIPYSATLVNMGFVERYFFPGMTVFLVAYMSFVGMLIKRIVNSITKKSVSVVIATLFVAILIVLNFRTNYFTDEFQFRNYDEKEMLSELSGKDVYVVVYHDRDLVYFSPLLYKSNNIFIDYRKYYDDEDFNVPEIGPDCLLLIVGGGLMTEDQKSEFLSDSTLTVDGLMKPESFVTLNDILAKIESDTGYSYVKVGDYYNFLGANYIYKVAG